MRNLLLTLAYKGTAYHGWQLQKNAVSVCEVFLHALYPILGERADVKGCSRTDAGVHARGYCVSVMTRSQIPCDKLVFALNTALPDDVAALSCEERPLDFHARYSAVGKEYIYQIYNSRIRNPFCHGLSWRYPNRLLNEHELQKLGDVLLGTHDFQSFCGIKSDVGDTVRTIRELQVTREGDFVTLRIVGDGFLYNMVRIIMGTLVKWQVNHWTPESLQEVLLACDRSKAGPTAPACGLYLNRVFYNE